jgi:hypothetical protein
VGSAAPRIVGATTMIPATNTARYEHLIGLARDCERVGRHDETYRQEKYLKLAVVYREMAAAAMPSAPDPVVGELAAKLRAMTVANGCTQAEADTAQQMLLRLDGG